MLAALSLGFLAFAPPQQAEPLPGDWPEVSGIYPHLAMFNQENECGTGGVVPWAGSLWVITYAPHKPRGSSDKLYQITPELEQVVREESVGGTPANRMIHRESEQLFLGPYVIDAVGKVRVIPYSEMLGRPTGTARHLTDPAGKVYTATMEEGLYEIDVETLAVTELFADTQAEGDGRRAGLPGYHGKGLYSGQGRLVYSNNGEYGERAMRDPRTASGVLAQWRGIDPETGEPRAWEVVRRNQFTEVTGPGGITGASADSDPLWAMGWDHKSVILQVLEDGQWHSYRLPKGSHAYDGAHGWNTEWPRIREIGPDHALLATMHGTFWAFPREFSARRAAGIRPLSNYLKIVGDFARWGDWVVFGCDDAAKSEFLNKRRAKGEIAGPGESQSNLWFVAPDQLAHFGPALGTGAVWMREEVDEGQVSDPFLAAGYAHRGLHLAVGGRTTARLAIELDEDGSGAWIRVGEVELMPGESRWIAFDEHEGEWFRLRALSAADEVMAVFRYANEDRRTGDADPIFAGLATASEQADDSRAAAGGVLHARGAGFRTLRFISGAESVQHESRVYDLDVALKLTRKDDPDGLRWTSRAVAFPADTGVSVDEASVLYVDDQGQRWRFPVGSDDLREHHQRARVAREVCTERDLLHLAGTFFELPAENAGGVAKVRPITTHNRAIVDFASYRGMLVMAGLAADAFSDSEHVVVSDDGETALWVGAVDDLWRAGKPRGVGGPWFDTSVVAGQPSDPYLMRGYDQKSFVLSADRAMKVRLEVDVTGDGDWVLYQELALEPETPRIGRFAPGFMASWLRAVPSADGIATLRLRYE